ncbi:MAG: tRNA pseudouridine(38-40) synthase TruA [Clostridia bacterium]|nr:tRNA pseudouridine(38-40) synthase TruA [Clostridia bacterium]
MKLLITVRYVGTRYCGYQVQPNGPTVQAALCAAAEALFGFPCDIVGCSRTDSGVHAECFCATISRRGEDYLPTNVPVERIPRALCRHLPEDIAVWGAKWVPPSFHARYDVLEKVYTYRIWNRHERDPFLADRAWHYPCPISDAQFSAMRDAAQRYVGEHDFAAFMAQGSSVTSTVRTVTAASVERQGDLILFRVAANGFLYNMVRIMAGTLIAVAEGKIAPDEIDDILCSRDRNRAGITAPACGLCLSQVVYSPEFCI